MYTDGADKDLLDIESQYPKMHGAFVVLENEYEEIVGSHATLPVNKSASLLAFKRLYLKQTLRGSGAGKHLMDWAVNWARDQGYRNVEFWSDTRFHRAHAFFKKYGFNCPGEIRNMEDGAMPYSEYFFQMELPV